MTYNDVILSINNWSKACIDAKNADDFVSAMYQPENVMIRWDAGCSGEKKSYSIQITRDQLLNLFLREKLEEAKTRTQEQNRAFNAMVEACVQFRIKHGDLEE